MYTDTSAGLQIKCKQLLPDFKQNKKWWLLMKFHTIKFNDNLISSCQNVTRGQTGQNLHEHFHSFSL